MSILTSGVPKTNGIADVEFGPRVFAPPPPPPVSQVKLAPAGTSKVQGMLQQGGMGCAQGGLTGVFTPMYLAVCRKPL